MFKLKVLPIALTLMCVSSYAFGMKDILPTPDEVTIKFGGWSNHIGTNGDKYRHNESHDGIGLQVSWDLGASYGANTSFWHMSDSNDRPQNNYEIGAYGRWAVGMPLLHSIDINLSLSYMNRTDRVRDFYTHETVSIDNWEGVIMYPHVTWRFTENFHADIMYFPGKPLGLSMSVFFWRLGYTF